MYTKFQFALHGVLALLSFPFLVLKDFIFGFTPNEALQKKNLSGYICLVTGGNTGVGKQTAFQLARCGATVVIGCRNSTRGNDAALFLQKRLQECDISLYPFASMGTVQYLSLDLSCFKSIKAFTSCFLKRYDHLDILVNNGGLNLKGKNKNGLQELFMVNYLGHYTLFRLLEPALLSVQDTKSDSTFVPLEARVVNVSSVMHHEGNSEFERSAFSKYTSSDSFSYYSDSKLYLNYLTMDINRRFRDNVGDPKKRKVSAISVNPGAVRSDIWRHVPWLISYPYDLFMRLVYLDVEQGAATSLFAATVPSTDCHVSTSLIPYVAPYRVYFGMLAFEMLGPFGGPKWATPSQPPNAENNAQSLWTFSKDLVNSLVKEFHADSSSNTETMFQLE